MRKKLVLLLSVVVLMAGTLSLFGNNPPRNLTAEAGDGYVNLQWDEPAPPVEGFFEGFEGTTFPPAGWLKLNPDGGTGWMRLTVGTAPLPGWTGGVAEAAPNGGNAFAYCSYTTGGTNSNDQWLITPAINVVSGDQLSFYVRRWPGNYLDNLDIKISTTIQNNVSAFTVTVAELVFPANGGSDAWVQYSYDLSAHAGQTIFIGFREKVSNNINDGSTIQLDNVNIAPATRLMAKSNSVEESTSFTRSDIKRAERGTFSTETTDNTVNETRELLGYKVYRNNVLLNAEPMLFTEYMDTDVVNETTYSYYVTAVYTDGDSGPSNTVQATPQGVLLPVPTDLIATIINNNTRVLLEWFEPTPPPSYEGWITWNNEDDIHDSIGNLESPMNYKVAHRFSPQELAAINADGSYLTRIKFAPGTAVGATYTLNVWTGGSATVPGQLVHEQVVAGPIPGQWNNIELTSPILIDATQELWFGYHTTSTTGHPAGVDSGPAINGSGNMMYFNNAWTTLYTVNSALNFNWNVEAYLSNGVALTQDQEIDLPHTENTRLELLGYNVYRNDMMINTSLVNFASFTDSSPLFNQEMTYAVTAVYAEGESEYSNSVEVTISTTNVDDSFNAPLRTALTNNYPNPFNPETTIAFSLAEAGMVELDVYNVKGQRIANLVNDVMNAGNHSVVWNGKTNEGTDTGSGIYFFRMSSGSYTATKKMILMK